MEFSDLQNKSKEELRELLSEKKESLRSLLFKAGESQLKQLHLLKNTRREIAQILSILNTTK